MQKTTVLHLFDYFPGSTTQNWLTKLIKNTPDCTAVIYAEHYTKHNLYDSSFRYINNPVDSTTAYERSIPKTSKLLFRKILFFLVNKLLGSHTSFLKEEIKKSNIEVAHAHFGHVACYYADLIKECGLPMVVSFYGYDYEYLPNKTPGLLEKYKQLFIKADKFVCEGTHGAIILKKMGCPPDKIEIVRLGVEPDKIPFRRKIKPVDSLKLIQIASLREKKGHIYSLRAFHAALANCPNMHLTLVGSGHEEIRNEIAGYIRSHQLADSVTLLNEINYDYLYEKVSSYDVFIHPSCYSKDLDCEGGAPIVLLDAQASGLPVIATTHCDIPDEVIHGTTGLLSPEKDIEDLCKSIQSFYRMEQAPYENFSSAGRKHVEEFFSIGKNAIHLKDLYVSLVKSKRK